MVVFYHLVWYFSKDPRYWRRLSFKHFSFGNLGVSFFFVLSGLVILLAHWKDLGRPASLSQYIVKRLQRIYPVYWIVLLPVIITLWRQPALGTGNVRDPLVLLSAFTLIHFRGNDMILLVSWTLLREMLFYICFAFLVVHVQLGCIALCAWFAACAAMAVHPFGPPILWLDLSPLHLLFLAGMLITLMRKRGVRLPPWPSIAVGIALFVYAAHATNRAAIADIPLLLTAGLGSFSCSSG